MVEVPPGACGGSILTMDSSAGPMHVTVPAGMQPGGMFPVAPPMPILVAPIPMVFTPPQAAYILSELAQPPGTKPVGFNGEAPVFDPALATTELNIPPGRSILLAPEHPSWPAPAPAPAISDNIFQNGLDKLFSLFAKLDQNRNGSVDARELHAAMEHSSELKTRLCEAAGVSPDGPTDALVTAVIAAADTSGNGSVEAAELERLLRGWRES